MMGSSDSLSRKMIRAAKLDVDLYEEVEADKQATWLALQVVLIASFSIWVGFSISTLWADDPPSIFATLAGLVLGSITGWLAWAFFAWIIGTTVFKTPETSASYGELLRTIGFAHAPLVLGIFFFVPVLGEWLYIGAGMWSLLAGIIAVRQALDFSTLRAMGTCLVGWIAYQILVVAIFNIF